MTRLLDDSILSSLTAEDIDALWAELQRRHAARNVEPELHDALVVRLGDIEAADKSKRLLCDGIRHELRHNRPSAVLHVYWREIIENRVALGHFLGGEVMLGVAA